MSPSMSPRRQPDLLRLVQHPVAPLSSNVVAEPDMGRQALSPDLAKFSHLHTNTEPGPSSQATPAGSSDKLEHVEKLLHASLEHDAQQQRLHMDAGMAATGLPDDMSPTQATDPSKESKRVCFDERTFLRHETARPYHYETRTARRPNLHGHMAETRQYMDSFIQQLQSQIEGASARWKREPVQELVTYQARSGASSPVVVHHARAMSLFRPWLWTWRVLIEFHAPWLSRNTRMSPGIYGQLMTRARDIVSNALHETESLAGQERANAVLRWYPAFVLRGMHSLLAQYTPTNDVTHIAAPHQRWAWDVHVVTITMPTVALWHMDVVVATCLELLLVYTQLGLSLLLAIMQRIQR